MNISLTASPGLPRAASAPRGVARAGLYRRIFADKPERSLWLRALTLAAALWSALSLLAVGVPPGIPLAAMAGLSIGHFLSHRRRRGVPMISVVIGVFIVVVGIWMRTDLVAAIRGDRIPVAYFLLATSAASAFDVRTRAGLYTQLIAAGIVMFLASELAFGSGFAPFAVVFGVIVMLFLAMAYLEDELEGAQVAWFKSRAGGVAFWAGTAVVIALFAMAAFFLLPWNAAQAPQAPRLTVMPFSGDAGGAPAITPEAARHLKDRLAGEGGPGGDGGPGGIGPGGTGFARGVGDSLIASVDGGFASIQELGGKDLSLSARVGEPLEPPPLGEGDDGVVMQVRSSIASYWRGRTFDMFDANDGPEGYGKWYATVQDEQPTDPVAAVGALSGTESTGRYLQTFFPQRDLGAEVLAGYRPVAAALPRNDRSRPEISKGSVYQIISVEPDFNSDSLREDSTRWQGAEYARIPAELKSLFALTGEIVAGAESDFDKAAAIASYLHQLEYDADAESQLRPRTPVDELVFGERPGTAIDFASAMTLMARAAGLPARVATGYLPGEYNPLSGASKVTEADSHAWSEIYFKEAGWVPFDAAPRPDLPVASGSDGAGPSGLGRLLDLRIGDSLASAATRAPGALWQGLNRLAESALASAGLIIASAVLAAGVYFLLSQLGARRSAALRHGGYNRIPGAWRLEVLDAFARAEASVARAGFRRRLPTEPFGDYAAAASSALHAGELELERLAQAAWQAAYSASAAARDLPSEAQAALRLLRTELRAVRREVSRARAAIP